MVSLDANLTHLFRALLCVSLVALTTGAVSCSGGDDGGDPGGDDGGVRGTRDLPARDTGRAEADSLEPPLDTGSSDLREPQADLPGCDQEVLKPDSGQLPNVLLVVDRSGSMGSSGEWAPTVAAVSSVTAALDSSVAFGLMLFPDPSSALNSCDTGQILVGTDLNQAGTIAAELSRYVPEGGTPTALSLRDAAEYLLTTYPDRPNYILLATDGGPTCNPDLTFPECTCAPGGDCTNQPLNCLDDMRTIATIENLALSGVPTFVIGVPGSEAVSEVLDQMAVAGGTDELGRHYAVSDEAALIATLSATSGSVVSCRFGIEGPPATAAELRLFIDGSEITDLRGRPNGWFLEAGRLIELTGSVCEGIRDGRPHAISILRVCNE